MDYLEKYKQWCDSANLEEKDREELLSIRDNLDEIKDRFSKDIEFGTGGLRGVIGAGTNRINCYVVRKTTQGFAQFIKNAGEAACHRGVVIAHDNRRFSIRFALETAGVLAANGIKAYLFDSLRPTPELSFAVRELGTFGGVMITASHNPPEYNGYKVYDERGCQLVPEVNDLLVAEIAKVEDPLSVRALSREEAGDLIVTVDPAFDEAYYKAVMSVSVLPDVPKNIKIVYSPQHGTGNVPVREVLDRLGYHVIPVLEQCEPDTEFSKTLNPNPEVADAYVLAIEYAKKTDADIVITTDPDCDRLGVAVKHNGEYVRMTGNQSAAVLLEYILSQKAARGTLPKNGVMFNTIVTSDLGDRICEHYGVSVEKTLTGFKFIGDKIHQHKKLGDKVFVFGYEESYGCLIADFVRDKDAVQAALMLCESAAYYHERGKTLIDALEALYRNYGFFLDALDNFVFKGLDGSERIRSLVDGLRYNAPKVVGDVPVAVMEDYETDEMIEKGFPKSNVLRFLMEDGSWVAVRPSGTEPKCKFYFSVLAENKDAAERKLVRMREVFEKDCHA